MKAEEKLIVSWVTDMLLQEGLITEWVKEQVLKKRYTESEQGNTDLQKTA